MDKKKIIILCTGNSCRSQIAEGYLRHFAGNTAVVFSAGIETHGLNPMAVVVMQEDGIDISHHTSNLISDYDDIRFDIVITVCDHALEQCPVIPGVQKQFHRNFPDPAKARGTDEERMAAFRNVRDEIRAYCEEFTRTCL